MNIESLEKLLLLEANVYRLDSTGLTKICENTDDWFNARSAHTKNLTPIEKIMDIVLISIEDMLEVNFSCLGSPIVCWFAQEPVGKYRADFVGYFTENPDVKYVIECDGHDFHEKTKEQAKYDKQRERFFVSNGYKVLRYSGSEIINDFEKIKQELFDLLSKDCLEIRK